MAEADGTWCLIESDPGVFSELIKQFGCTNVQVEELYTMDKEIFDDLKPVFGLIFLFKYVPKDAPDGSVVKDSRLGDIFFARQVIENACASLAIINALMNCDTTNVQLGSILTEFKTFTQDFDAVSRGHALTNCDQIRKVHNSFSRQQVFDMSIKTKEKEDVYHFVSYVPIKGRVYELDGTVEGPIDLGKIEEGQDWLDVVRPLIQKRMQKYSSEEIHFNLLAITDDKKAAYQRQIEEIVKCDQITEADRAKICRLNDLIAQEDDKKKRYMAENVRRKHNYVPFIVELLKVLAAEGKLVPIVEKAIDKAKKEQEEKRKQKKEDSVMSD